MASINKQVCPTCGQSVNKRKICLFEGMVTALWRVYKWCKEQNRHEFQKKEVQHLLQQNSISGNFAYWRWWGGGLVYNPKNTAGWYGLNMERCDQFFKGKLAIPTVIYEDPLAKNGEKLTMPEEEYKTIKEIPRLEKFLNEEGLYIAEYSGEPRTNSERATTVPIPQMRPQEHGGRKITAYVSEYTISYVLNENNKGFRMTLAGYGSCTPADVMQNWIDNLSIENWEKLYQQCENGKLWPF